MYGNRNAIERNETESVIHDNTRRKCICGQLSGNVKNVILNNHMCQAVHNHRLKCVKAKVYACVSLSVSVCVNDIVTVNESVNLM